ncbi:MAG: protoporphyrinogen oxidase, partial [Thermoflexus sp.]
MRVIIVGGGIAGLSVAYFLERAAAEGRWQGEVLLIEREHLLGGKITTVREDGFIVEGGPDSLLRAKLEGTSLLQELGLEEELISPQARTVYVLRRGRLHPIPETLLMLRPDPLAVWRARSLPWWGRLRALLEPWVPPRREGSDESLAAFLRRRFGRAFAENIAEPLMAGVHAGDPESLSMQALYPYLLALERNFGSIARGLRRGRPPGTSESMFVSLRSGMGVLVERLAASLHRAHLVLGRTAIGIAPIPGEGSARYRVAL